MLPSIILLFGCSLAYDTTGGPREGVINVHLACHSHDDVGWLKTADQYFSGFANEIVGVRVSEIYDSVLAELQKSKDRKFVIVEIYFFSRWWRKVSPLDQETFRQLVREKRLTFLNGGWVMNDEACPLFTDMIDQMSLGAETISSLFGTEALPVTGWQIDPFGHSRFQAELFALSGYSGYFMGRLDFQDTAVRKRYRQMETTFRGIFAGFLDGTYVAPKGLKWSRFGDDPIQDDREIDSFNVEEKLLEFYQVMKTKFEIFNPLNASVGDVMLTMGDDFEYQDARSWFDNIDKLIHYSNQFKFPGAAQINIFYSTPEIYMQERLRKGAAKESIKSDISDFFPYCDGYATAANTSSIEVSSREGGHAYWTGYFASRVNLKRQIRQASELLRTGELLLFILKSDEIRQVRKLREMIATLQHHDNISGTQREAVARSDSAKLAGIVQEFVSAVEILVANATGLTAITWDYASGDFMNSSALIFNPSTTAVGDFSPLSLTFFSTLQRITANSSADFGGVATIAYYRSSSGENVTERRQQADGAYIFRPDCPEGNVEPCLPVRANFGEVSVKRRDDMEVGRPSARVYEMRYSIPPIPIDDETGKNVVIVFDFPDLENVNASRPVMFTDSNGRGLIRRVFNHREDYVLNVTDPVSSNFYPFTTLAIINDSAKSVSILTDRPLGAGVLRKGQIEVMIHRRSLRDDWRGVGEALNQTDSVRGRFLIVVDSQPEGGSSFAENLVDLWTMFPLQAFSIPGRGTPKSREISRFSGIPASVAVLTARQLPGDNMLLRLYHKHTEHGLEEIVDLGEVLNLPGSLRCQEMAVNGVKPLSEVKQPNHPNLQKPGLISPSSLRIAPGDIRTVVCKKDPFVLNTQTLIS